MTHGLHVHDDTSVALVQTNAKVCGTPPIRFTIGLTSCDTTDNDVCLYAKLTPTKNGIRKLNYNAAARCQTRKRWERGPTPQMCLGKLRNVISGLRVSHPPLDGDFYEADNHGQYHIEYGTSMNLEREMNRFDLLSMSASTI